MNSLTNLHTNIKQAIHRGRNSLNPTHNLCFFNIGNKGTILVKLEKPLCKKLSFKSTIKCIRRYRQQNKLRKTAMVFYVYITVTEVDSKYHFINPLKTVKSPKTYYILIK